MGKEYHDKPVVVKHVHSDGSATAAGIKAGWHVTEVNGQEVHKLDPLDLETAACGALDPHSLKMQSILDVMDDFRKQIPLLRVYIENMSDREAQVRSLAAKAADIDSKPDSVKTFEGDVRFNLRAIEPLSNNVVRVLQVIIKDIDRWKFDTTGEVNTPPMLTAIEDRNLELSQADLNALHTLCYIHYPPAFHNHLTYLGITGSLCRGMSHVEYPDCPIAIITVGPPGSGKSFMIESKNGGLLNYLQVKHGGPPPADFVEIDPDYWITHLADNDNARRPLCNMLNLENFFFSINQRYNIIFGGTGKDIKNTAGRVTARLKQAGYRIYYAILLSEYENCKQRIRDRFEKTGRDVPDFIVRAIFKELQQSIPIYLKNQAEMCEEVLIYTNNTIGSMPEPTILRAGQDPTQALELVAKNLALPSEEVMNASRTCPTPHQKYQSAPPQ
jgi:predicted ABC-type ATPase